jgi:hypothetical protein
LPFCLIEPDKSLDRLAIDEFGGELRRFGARAIIHGVDGTQLVIEKLAIRRPACEKGKCERMKETINGIKSNEQRNKEMKQNNYRKARKLQSVSTKDYKCTR